MNEKQDKILEQINRINIENNREQPQTPMEISGEIQVEKETVLNILKDFREYLFSQAKEIEKSETPEITEVHEETKIITEETIEEVSDEESESETIEEEVRPKKNKDKKDKKKDKKGKKDKKKGKKDKKKKDKKKK
ncbi:hypothetical protein GPJ56_005465 [Histomonas meleagridis]|uniref:uncharacterized protein n=1 Tax=Histomonas meleagridis TaxID=135588 RepID=UPI00355A26B3|nr:hypothetical protein GPJ56_005465 [Histomonas meleagridis]KAH0802489.1 hypothetical protein GO595_004538 [Histomonas meleagridis]